jgi:hypothetical protein
MKEIALSEKELRIIRSNAIDLYVASYRGEQTHTYALIQSFIDFCSHKGYIVKDGKVYSTNEEEKKST